MQNPKRLINTQFSSSQETADELGYEDTITWLKYF